MNKLTAREVRLDMITTVRAIVPAYPYRQDAIWRPTDRWREVEGADVRVFYVQVLPPTHTGLSIHADGVDVESSLRVWTSYRGVPDSELEGMIPDDARQLWIAIDARTSPVLSGFLSPTPLGWSSANDDEGHCWGYHEFNVRWLSPITA